MSWGYRVVRQDHGEDDLSESGRYYTFSIHEAYSDDEGDIHSITKKPITLETESLTDLEWQVNKIQSALQKPILIYEDF